MRTFITMALAFTFASGLYAQKEMISVIQTGDTIVILNKNATENCAALFSIDVSINGTGITIVETDPVIQKARCMCYFDLSARLTGLGAGTYTVDVYRQYWKRYAYPEDSRILIGTTSFNIVIPAPLPRNVETHQSECSTPTDIGTTQARTDAGIKLSWYPNPSVSGGAIRLELPEAARVTIKLFDVLGNEIAVLAERWSDAGTFTFSLPQDYSLQSGMYYCVAVTDTEVKSVSVRIIR
jgi:hypothetical protein